MRFQNLQRVMEPGSRDSLKMRADCNVMKSVEWADQGAGRCEQGVTPECYGVRRPSPARHDLNYLIISHR